MEKLKSYLDDIGVIYSLEGDFIVISGKTYNLCESEGNIIDEDYQLVGVNEESDYQVFEFGGKYYYSDTYDPKFNELRYVGLSEHYDSKFTSFLGVHGQMEILSGSRLYDDWVSKANFLGIKSLGICELNSLAGLIKFQNACQEGGIKPILGMSAIVKDSGSEFVLNLFIKDEIGWQNMLKINKEINILNGGFIHIEDIKKMLGGIIVVIDTKGTNFNSFKASFEPNWYYTIEPIEYALTSKDNAYFDNLVDFLKSSLNPIMMYSSYYLESDDAFIIPLMESISKQSHGSKAINQHFMPLNEYEELLVDGYGVSIEPIIEDGLANLRLISDSVEFFVPPMTPERRHLPEYILSPEEEEEYGDADTLMQAIIENGLHEKIPAENHPEYRKRIEHELSVIRDGNVTNYFLILWDIILWARGEGILVGVGRGSAAGSMVSYLMDITRIDPFKYNLLFERFLNPGRAKVSLPDIDVDFSGERRGEVKEYIMSKYGKNQFCEVGTYTNLKPKSLIKEYARLEGMEHWHINEMTKFWPEIESFGDIIKLANSDGRAKQFIKDNPSLVNDLNLLLGQPKAQSIHACATIIAPDEKEIFDQIPVKWMVRDGERTLVSQWEGPELESVGFLKEDILGIKQLDKYEMILELIHRDKGENIDLYSIPLNDPDVLAYFQNGDNSDIFHFGSVGLSGYCKEMKPQSMDELIAGIALYRPGPMHAGFHKKYIKLKNGLSDVTYPPQCEDITKDTFGLLIYQEQIMLICQHVGGLSLEEADSIRKSMVKKDLESISKFTDRFFDYATNHWKIPIDEVTELWDLLVGFAEYGFNKSHAASYTITAYYGQWFKHYYPTQFWETAFTFAKDTDYSRYLSEIHNSGKVKMNPPDINISSDRVVSKDGRMFWSLKSVKGVGEKAYEQILKVREEVGSYNSLEHFITVNSWKADKKNGIEGSKVNKTTIEALIASGSFDVIEDINEYKQRSILIEEFRSLKKIKVDAEKDWFTNGQVDQNWFWATKQKSLSGVSFLDYDEIVRDVFEEPYYNKPEDIDEAMEYEDVKVCGFIDSIIIRKTRKKQNMASIVLEHNFETINVTIWPDDYEENKGILKDSVGKILFMDGKVRFDEYKGSNTVYSSGGYMDTIN